MVAGWFPLVQAAAAARAIPPDVRHFGRMELPSEMRVLSRLDTRAVSLTRKGVVVQRTCSRWATAS